MIDEKLCILYRLLNNAIANYVDGDDDSIVIENIIHARAILEQYYGMRQPHFDEVDKLYNDAYHDGRNGFQHRLYMTEVHDEKG